MSFSSVSATSPKLDFVAGNIGGAGTLDAKGASARFTHPLGMTTDAKGNLYTVDAQSHTIRQIDLNGNVSTYLGTPNVSGSKDGARREALFFNPYGIKFDAKGNAYITDTLNSTLRKLTPDGQVTTLAGAAGQEGAVDGMGAAARFNRPHGIAIDKQGNIYVTDTFNNTIRKITPQGMVSTIAGTPNPKGGTADGTGAAAQFNSPHGLTIDNDDNLYVTEYVSHTIRKITPQGVVSTFVGQAGVKGSADGVGSQALFNSPVDISFDPKGQLLYVADTWNYIIRTITLDGKVSRIAGQIGEIGFADGDALTQAQFNHPGGLAFDPFSGNLYINSSWDNIVRKMDLTTNQVSTIGGLPKVSGTSDGIGAAVGFNNPQSSVLDEQGNLYIVDSGNHTVRKLSNDGYVSTIAGTAGKSGFADGTAKEALFNNPLGLAINKAGTLYVADSKNHVIRKIANGTVSTIAGIAGKAGATDGMSNTAQFNNPYALVVDAQGNIFVTDNGNQTIRAISPTGVVSTLAGSAGKTGATDGLATNALFNNVTGITLDSKGNIYIADSGNQLIRQLTPNGMVTTVVGTPSKQGATDGNSTAALINQPTGLTADATDNIYIADTGNSAVRKIDPNQQVTTVVGIAGTKGIDPTTQPPTLSSPVSLALKDNTLYIVDENAILKSQR